MALNDRRYTALWLPVVCTLAACSGNIQQDWQRTGDGASAAAGLALGRADVVPMRRLTTVQYKNSVADIFGTSVVPPPLNVQDLSVNGLPTAGAASVGMPATDAEAFTGAAANIAQQATVVAMRPHFSCQPKDADDTDCLGQIVTAYGRRLFRRPLTDTQKAAYVALAQKMGSADNDAWAGVSAALAAMLQSPYFLFRVDTAQTADKDPTSWDAHTLASRMAYLVWNSAPDDALLDAADSGALLQPDVLAAQADRLLQDPRADTGLFEFFDETLQLDAIGTAQKDPNVFTPALSEELAQQVELTLKDLLLTSNSDYRTLFTSQAVYINADLATRYGYPAPSGTGFTKITYAANDRAGLFGLPGITTMLSPSNRSSPTKRGAYIRQALLCTTIPSPPATVNTAIATDVSHPRTMRQIMSEHATNAECSGCHMLMDPLGFALDDFDWLGNYRTTDNGLPLDLSGSVDGHTFVNTRTFGAALAADTTVTDCLTQRFLLYATADANSAQSALDTELKQAFAASGFTFKSLVRAYLTSDAFRRAAAL